MLAYLHSFNMFNTCIFYQVQLIKVGVPLKLTLNFYDILRGLRGIKRLIFKTSLEFWLFIPAMSYQLQYS